VNERDNLILGKRIDESEMCILIHLLQRPPCTMCAIWYHTVLYGAIGCHMGPHGESRHMVECGMVEMCITIPNVGS
jgi:hypothetical protein